MTFFWSFAQNFLPQSRPGSHQGHHPPPDRKCFLCWVNAIRWHGACVDPLPLPMLCESWTPFILSGLTRQSSRPSSVFFWQGSINVRLRWRQTHGCMGLPGNIGNQCTLAPPRGQLGVFSSLMECWGEWLALEVSGVSGAVCTHCLVHTHKNLNLQSGVGSTHL